MHSLSKLVSDNDRYEFNKHSRYSYTRIMNHNTSPPQDKCISQKCIFISVILFLIITCIIVVAWHYRKKTILDAVDYDSFILYNGEDVVSLMSFTLATMVPVYDFKSMHDYNKNLRISSLFNSEFSENFTSYLEENNVTSFMNAHYNEFSVNGVYFSSNRYKYKAIGHVETYTAKTVKIFNSHDDSQLAEFTTDTPSMMFVVKLCRIADRKEFYFVNIQCPFKESDTVDDPSGYAWLQQAFNTLKKNYNEGPFVIAGSFNVNGFEKMIRLAHNDFHIGDFIEVPTRRISASTEGFLVSKSLYDRIEFHSELLNVQFRDRYAIVAKLYVKHSKPGVFLSREWPLNKALNFTVSELPASKNKVQLGAQFDHFMKDYPLDSTYIDNMDILSTPTLIAAKAKQFVPIKSSHMKPKHDTKHPNTPPSTSETHSTPSQQALKPSTDTAKPTQSRNGRSILTALLPSYGKNASEVEPSAPSLYPSLAKWQE